MKTVVFDFDGVIHSYKSGWQGIDVIPDEPVEGIGTAIDSIRNKGYKVVIVSTRCSTEEGKLAIAEWLNKYNIVVDDVVAEKPPAIVYVDDRAITFDGDCNTLLDKIESFKPWYNK